MTNVNPKILRWARRSAALSLDEAAHKIDLRAAGGLAATDRLIDIEKGEAEPSAALLRRMAKQYRRPLIAFYLDEIPAASNRGVDFRGPNEERSERQEALLSALLREVYASQDLLRAALVEEDGVPVRSFVGSRRIRDGSNVILRSLTELLEMDHIEYRQGPDVKDAFAKLRLAAERQGVFVMLKGNLGSHHSAIEAETFRGLSIADEYAPFIVINENDAHTAWSFTLLHELVHLLLGQTGVSGMWCNTNVERMCDDIAGHFLFPPDEVAELSINDQMQYAEIANQITEAANARLVSRSMVAYRAYRSGLIRQDQLSRLLVQFRTQWRNRQAHKRQSDDLSRPGYYVVRRHRVGKSLANTVKGLMESGALSTTKAARVMGVKPQNVGKLVDFGAF